MDCASWDCVSLTQVTKATTAVTATIPEPNIFMAVPPRRVRLPVSNDVTCPAADRSGRTEEHTAELQSLMRTSYAAFRLKKQSFLIIDNNYTIGVTTQDKYK